MVGRDEFDFTDRRVVILGLARQGSALARFFVHQGAQVVVSDAAPVEQLQPEIEALGALPVELVLGAHPTTLLDGCDLLCLSGGVPPQIDLVQTAIARGVRLSNDSLLTLQLARRRGLGPIFAITGSSGKTTTTTLVGLMLEAAGKRVHVGGNIGTPLIDRLENIAPGDCIVLELSSFQLELFDPSVAWGGLAGSGPDVAAILNVTPNHLDRHASMADYAAAKFNLLHFLLAGATVVLNADDAVTGRVARCRLPVAALPLPASWQVDAAVAEAQSSIVLGASSIVCFSTQQTLCGGAWLDGERLVYNGRPFAERREVQVRGDHNISNLLAAAAISGVAGVEPAAMHEVATTFAGVPHRLETIAEDNGTIWINDSIATSPERAVAALRSFSPGAQTLILLAGGKDKNLPWERFAEEVIERVSYLIGFGQAGAMIVNTVQDHARYLRRPAPNTAVVQRLDEAVELAARVAQIRPRCGNTVVLLSPGGTSYDAYKDFEARGAHFRQLVAKWTELEAVRNA
ncbi:MAG: UDP-N-acetylmuramoyl-L-alanine--D-glutamate ligase [Chloroflexi bacterium]|nr:MAG: UDP-N-acetylmuramoyl-L-alanine--D-glutamate ligase [Chloroflexota bacterium]